MTISPYTTIGVTVFLSVEAQTAISEHFETVHYYPDGDIPKELVADVDIWFCDWVGLPDWITFDMIPNTKVIQLTSAGANLALKSPALQSKQAKDRIAVCSASGIHSLTIPQYIVGQIINLYMNLHTSVIVSRIEKRWITPSDLNYRSDRENPARPLMGFPSLRGKTAGILGYGHIGRETARLLEAFGVNIIAANSNGSRRVDDGYIIPGTGDKNGSIPSAYYSTNDPLSFQEFLSRSQILIASLPSTPGTRWLLTEKHFKALPPDALFINVGRGDLAHSEDIIAALDEPNGLLAVALDVTDPEPLPNGHPLLSHPRAVITPHIAADFEDVLDVATDLLLANLAQIKAGGKPINVVDPAKGY